jgi:hypothetical protein
MATVEFCRINRRTLDRSLQVRPLIEDLTALANSGETIAEVRRTTYRAADLRLDASSTFMTGLLGFSERDVLRQFEDDAFSWLKGEIQEIDGATTATVVPFAIDLREHRRWVAYALSHRIRSNVFRQALSATLNHAVAALGLLPTEWEVDPVMSARTIEEWVNEHTEVVVFTRRVKLTNALKDVDEARRKMRELGATRQEETFRAPRGESLDVQNNHEFEEMIGGVETGDMEVVLEARVGKGRTRFRSTEHTDRTTIPDFGADLEHGIDLVLNVLRTFSEQRGDVLHGDREHTE